MMKLMFDPGQVPGKMVLSNSKHQIRKNKETQNIKSKSQSAREVTIFAMLPFRILYLIFPWGFELFS
jgi:hypothetical protein